MARSFPILTVLLSVTIVSTARAEIPLFEKQIRPILKVHCFHCHGEDRQRGGLDLRLVRLIVEGGGAGPAIVPGETAHSLLLERVRKGEMPKSGKKLTAQEIGLLEQWIAAGAKTARPEPENPDDAAITEEERAFWAFQPVKRPAIGKPPDGGAGKQAMEGRRGGSGTEEGLRRPSSRPDVGSRKATCCVEMLDCAGRAQKT